MPRDPVREANDHDGTFIEKGFENIGEKVGAKPCTSIFATLLVCFLFAAGWAFGETESRPDQQWIAKGSPALVQQAFIKEAWPSNQRFNFFVAKCKDKTKPCNILEAKYVKRIWKVYNDIMNIQINGTKFVEEEVMKEYPKAAAGTFDS